MQVTTIQHAIRKVERNFLACRLPCNCMSQASIWVGGLRAIDSAASARSTKAAICDTVKAAAGAETNSRLLASRLSVVAAARRFEAPSSVAKRRTRQASPIIESDHAASGDFKTCMQLLRQLAAASSSTSLMSSQAGKIVYNDSNGDSQLQQASMFDERIAGFDKHRKPEDLWLLTTSGWWATHDQGKWTDHWRACCACIISNMPKLNICTI